MSYIHSPWLVDPRKCTKGQLGITKTHLLASLELRRLGQRAIEGIALCISDLIEAYLKVIQKIGRCFKS